MARILVPFNGSSSSEAALHAACRMAHANGDEAHVVYVIRVSRHLPIWADMSVAYERVERVFTRADTIAASYGVSLGVVHVTARYVGWGIVAAAEGYDLVLFGPRRRRLYRRILPDTTLRHVAARAPCQVLILSDGAAPPIGHPLDIREMQAQGS
jgi:nucleotide-binding universal stress UspA family protein